MIATILTGRLGGILIDNVVIETFRFLSGSGQGDSPSPLLFVIGMEPLIIKIDYDSSLTDASFMVNNRPLKANRSEAYADDLNNVLKFSRDNLLRLKSIFDDFQKVSSLQINEEKTVIIPLCNSPEMEDFVRKHTKFKIDRKFKLLGFNIDANLNNLESNFDIVIHRIENIISFWKNST